MNKQILFLFLFCSHIIAHNADLLNKTVNVGTISLPILGIGTLEATAEELSRAVDKHFLLFDTAKAYENEHIVGDVVAQKESIIVTKLFRPNCENRKTLKNAVLDSIQKLGKVPELFLIHGPYPDVPMLSLIIELEALKQIGLVREWGVSNFEKEHIGFLIHHGYKPVLNQIEYHPYFQRPELLELCRNHKIIVQAYRPIAQGYVLQDEVLNRIAKKWGVTPAQCIYAWLFQLGVTMVTKVSSEQHQQDYALSHELVFDSYQLHDISNLNKQEFGRTCTTGGWHGILFTEEIKKRWIK